MRQMEFTMSRPNLVKQGDEVEITEGKRKYIYIVKIVIFFTKKSGLFHRKYKKVINSVRKCYKLCRIVLKKIQSDKDIVYIEKTRIYAVFGTLHNLLKIFLKNSN